VLSGMLRILVVALVLLVAVMFALPRPSARALPENATLLPEPRALPEVTLIDDTGRPFDWAALEGRHALLFFGFTNCPDVCPLTLQVLARTRAALLERNPDSVPAIVFVSVDPNRDTPERIAAYLNNFDPEFAGVTGSDEALAPLLAALGVAVEKHEHGGANYNVVHNSAVYVLDANADWVAVSTAPHDPQVLAADFLRIRQRHGSSAPPGA
jgi:protein SCO1